MLPIHRIEVPNPFFEGQNSAYLLKGDPVTLIDTGVATDRAFERLAHGVAEHGIQISDIQRVLLTHKHIDHIGNAWRIQSTSGADVLIHACEQKSLTDVDPSGQRFVDMVQAKLRTWGLPDGLLNKTGGTQMPQWDLEPCEVASLPEVLPIDFGTQTYALEVINTPGHTMGSVCFRLEQSLFSGDHILERISPNVGGGDMRGRGMLARFLTSLETVRQLGDLTVMPGHGTAFRGLEARCDKLRKHHEIRLRQARRAVECGKSSVWEVARALYGKLDDFHIVLGCAEANAHLEYLVDDGTLGWSEEEQEFFLAETP